MGGLLIAGGIVAVLAAWALEHTRFAVRRCAYCRGRMPRDAVVCGRCGREAS